MQALRFQRQRLLLHVVIPRRHASSRTLRHPGPPLAKLPPLPTAFLREQNVKSADVDRMLVEPRLEQMLERAGWTEDRLHTFSLGLLAHLHRCPQRLVQRWASVMIGVFAELLEQRTMHAEYGYAWATSLAQDASQRVRALQALRHYISREASSRDAMYPAAVFTSSQAPDARELLADLLLQGREGAASAAAAATEAEEIYKQRSPYSKMAALKWLRCRVDAGDVPAPLVDRIPIRDIPDVGLLHWVAGHVDKTARIPVLVELLRRGEVKSSIRALADAFHELGDDAMAAEWREQAAYLGQAPYVEQLLREMMARGQRAKAQRLAQQARLFEPGRAYDIDRVVKACK